MADPTASQPQQQGGAPSPQDQQSLMGFATAAEENLVKLATGLAQAGAQPGTVTAIHHMADVTRQITQALGQSNPGNAAPAGQPQQQGGPQQQQPASPQQGQQQQPEQAPTMDAATQFLHAAMQHSAALRQGGQARR